MKITLFKKIESPAKDNQAILIIDDKTIRIHIGNESISFSSILELSYFIIKKGYKYEVRDV